MRRTLRLFASAALLLLAASPAVYSESHSAKDTVLANEYVAIIQNQSEDGKGRFSIHTTEGNPEIEGDEDRHLLYGMENPWTSYTTILIDGKPFIFGGPSTRRAGTAYPTGEIVAGPSVVENDTVMTVRFDPGILVTQKLSITESPTTGHADSVSIEYTFHNETDSPHSVGMRIMLDTMLGENDGAPLRLHDQYVLTDSIFLKYQTPDFWQAFDNLTEPKVISQGTLVAPGLTPPDRIVVSNWGTLADHPWNVPVETGRPLIREGEFDIDSAIALFWNPITLNPGEKVTYSTLYGLGGITRTVGDIALGLTSPTFVHAGAEFTVVAYVQTTRGVVNDVSVSLQVPEGFTVIEEPTNPKLDQLEYMDIRQFYWRLQAPERGVADGLLLRAESPSFGETMVQRKIDVLAPEISIDVDVPDSLPVRQGKLAPVPIRVTVTNVGQIRAYRPRVDLLSEGLRLRSPSQRHLVDLKPGESVSLTWYVDADPDADVSTGVLRIGVTAMHADPVTVERSLIIPQIPQRIELRPATMIDPTWWRAELYAYKVPAFHEILIDASYSEGIDVANISPGELMAAHGELLGETYTRVDPKSRHIQVVIKGGEVVAGTGPLLAFHLKGEGSFRIDRLQIYTVQGHVFDVPASPRTTSVSF